MNVLVLDQSQCQLGGCPKEGKCMFILKHCSGRIDHKYKDIKLNEKCMLRWGGGKEGVIQVRAKGPTLFCFDF
jgi:hypothetical protein